MLPILFHIGNFAVHTYGLVVLLAIVLGTQVGITLARYTMKQYEEHIVPLVYTSVIGAVIGARIWQVFFFEPNYYLAHPLEMIAFWNGGLSIQGGIVGGILTGFWYCKRKGLSFWKVADLLAPSIILGQGIGRIACLLNGDAFGSPTGKGYGLVYPPGTFAYDTYGSKPLWPAEVWEGQIDFVIFAILFALLRKKLPTGTMFVLYNILYALARFGLEFLRGDSPRYLFHWTAAQWTSAAIVFIGIAALLVLRMKDRNVASTLSQS
ncbi:prolipoprotein diacylglyceryl transferase [Fodinisporobacter ferrooxydans]|uniref:Phosphatidylglycerol--prolipoprotein diacylglyceryl transferase n=1 Tax=Fodinisporobacter ferrooxydans TaxID=2901836 RepID=A0ABY4CK84_9BACL|nr:prolipoprotein diacylglyceryl transferase [Alicyclobacillaceae bacterium MYW30-H2]